MFQIVQPNNQRNQIKFSMLKNFKRVQESFRHQLEESAEKIMFNFQTNQENLLLGKLKK
jgi:hypothetical protein